MLLGLRMRMYKATPVYKLRPFTMAVRRDRVTAPELEEFVALEVHLTGVNLGTGAYGAVQEATIPGATIAAKKLHPELVNLGSPEQVRKWISDFVEECKLMSQLRHPHVVQFMGICYFPESHLPVLLMEKLLTSLDNLLETTPNIPLDVKVYLLTGTGRGVVYLHSRAPPVIHRDLTARNILIDSGLTSKIADLGVARMVNIQPGQRAATMTQGPGNGLYMPPEAMVAGDASRYNTSIDIFSFGVVGLFTLTQTFPKDLKPATYIDPTTRRLVARSEIERRVDYIDPMKASLGEDHPLVKMTLDCLDNDPQLRPSAEEVLTRLEEVGSTIPQQCTETKLELIQRTAGHHEEIQQVRAEVRDKVRTEVQIEHQRQLAEQQAQIELLQTTNSQQQARIDSFQEANSNVQEANEQLHRANHHFQAEKQEQVTELEELITLQQQQLEDQRREIERLSDQLRSLPLEGTVHRPQGAGQREVPKPNPSPQPKIPSSIDFNWRQCSDMPQHVQLNDKPVALNGKLYIRGFTSGVRETETVLQYTPGQDQWRELPEPPVYNFTTATHNGQLLVVGGMNKFTHKPTNTILTFDEHSHQWVQSYPVMPTAVTTPAAIGYQDYLIVAGGRNSKGNIDLVADVNILNTSTVKWITAESLPTAITGHDRYHSVLIKDAVYLVGQNTKQVLRAHVPTLASGAVGDVWESLENVPFYWSTPVATKHMLLTVGGRSFVTRTSSIHMYDPTENQWTKVGDLPKAMNDLPRAIQNCSCTILSGQLFVLGGWDNHSVYVAKLNFVY